MSENLKQGHLTMTVPLKSPADVEAFRNELEPLLEGMFRGADEMGTVHYCRLTTLDETTLLLIADFDGTLDTVLADMCKHLGPFLDAIFEHAKEAPPTPVADNEQAFVKWAKAHHIEEFTNYMAYPGADVQQIKSLASAAGINLDAADAQQLPLLLIAPFKGALSFVAVKTLFTALKPLVRKG